MVKKRFGGKFKGAAGHINRCFLIPKKYIPGTFFCFWPGNVEFFKAITLRSINNYGINRPEKILEVSEVVLLNLRRTGL